MKRISPTITGVSGQSKAECASYHKSCISKALIILVFISLSALSFPSDFLTEQKRYPRVRAAINEKEEIIEQLLATHGMVKDDIHVLFRAFKDERKLEVFAKKTGESEFIRIKAYNICRISGSLGPKRRQGDRQVPEGFYHIDRFNPDSRFHLSLGINYPNTADRRKSTARDPGDNIFIHGNCVSDGCLAMTDDKIKEIYLLAVYARNSGQQRIPVYIFPFEMNVQKMERFTRQNSTNDELITFWINIKTGFDLFEQQKKKLGYTINQSGDYVFL